MSYENTYAFDDVEETVGSDEDSFPTFKALIDDILATYGYCEGLKLLGVDSCEGLAEALTNNKGIFSENCAMDLCMDNLGGYVLPDNEAELEADDMKYERAAGK